MERDIAFQMAASNLRFGRGVTGEIGMDLAEMEVRRAMLLTDPNLVGLPAVQSVREALAAEKIAYELYDGIQCEPTDASFRDAIAYAQAGKFDGFVAVGGGSTIDTAKVANLYATFPDEFLAYVNLPIGEGKPVPGPLKPLVAVPTTAGTGSETTGVAIFDMIEMHAKTGIADRRLKPTLGIVDADNTRTMPPVVAASTGLDVLCHALEAYTAIPFTNRPRPERPNLRPAYQGSNPLSDIWALRALEIGGASLARAVADPSDDEARQQMIMASAFAGMGFGNAGVHLCHGMSYPVSGMVRDYKPDGYVGNTPIVPHGMAVALNAPGVFRFTGPACPGRHLRAAAALGVDVSGVTEDDAGDVLADCVTRCLQELDMPNGLAAVGYTSEDIPALVEGTLPQHRVTKLSPREFTEDELAGMFADNLRHW